MRVTWGLRVSCSACLLPLYLTLPLSLNLIPPHSNTFNVPPFLWTIWGLNSRMSTPLVRSSLPLLSCKPLSHLVHSTEKRKAEAERIRQKYPDRIPVSRTVTTPSRSPMLTDTCSCCAESTGYLREGRSHWYSNYWQEEVPCAICKSCLMSLNGPSL